MRPALFVTLPLVLACFPVYVPRGVVTAQSRDGGSIALYNEDDVEPSQRLALQDAQRQMAAHCAPRGYEITGRDRYDTGNTIAVNVGYGVTQARRVLVTQLHYVCR